MAGATATTVDLPLLITNASDGVGCTPAPLDIVATASVTGPGPASVTVTTGTNPLALAESTSGAVSVSLPASPAPGNYVVTLMLSVPSVPTFSPRMCTASVRVANNITVEELEGNVCALAGISLFKRYRITNWTPEARAVFVSATSTQTSSSSPTAPGGHIDHFPIAFCPDPLPPGNPQSAIIPNLFDSIIVPPGLGSSTDIYVECRSYPACHPGSNCRVEIQCTDQATGEVASAGSGYTVVGPNYTGCPFASTNIPCPAEYQVNQAGSSLDLDDEQGTPQAPAIVCALPVGTINLGGTFGLPWEIAITPSAPVSASDGALVTSGMQILNVDLTDPGLFFLNGLTFSTPFPGPVTFNYTMIPNQFAITAQQGIIDPTSPDGVWLSQPSQLVGAPMTTLAGPATDDGFVQVPAGLLGGPPSGSFAFAGQFFSDLFVNANGSVTFGAPDASFTATVAAFLSGPPRIAGMWTDLSPNVGGSITNTLSCGTFTSLYLDVPEFGAPSTQNSFRIHFDAASATIQIYTPDLLHATDTLVGFSPGPFATDPGTMGGLFPSILSAAGTGPHPAGTDAIYEFTSAGAPAEGWDAFSFDNDRNYTVF